MKLQFLGTSAGVPTKQRNVTGLALSESEGKGWYLIDCGEATQHQLLHTHLTLNTLKAIFITHVHGDHSYGLPGILASAAMNGRKN
nr:MBL fold metallo-hydrolase [Shewanella shenzhenensis]